MRRLVCLFLASFFVSQDALAQDGMEVAIRAAGDLIRNFIGTFIEPNAGSILAFLVVALFISIVFFSVILYAISWLFDKAFKSDGISLRPSVSTFIAYVSASVSAGILAGIEDGMRRFSADAIIQAIAFFAALGFLPAIIVWVVKRNRTRRLRNPPEPLEEALEP